MLALYSGLVGCSIFANDAAPDAEPDISGASAPQPLSPVPPGLSALAMFDGNTGQPYEWAQLIAAMDKADVIIIGESHEDARGHAIQAEIIGVAAERWDGLTLSLEEFDRSQQASLDEFAAGQLTARELKDTRSFVMPVVRDNWEQWSLPKLEAARQADVPMLAANAPLKYSRMARNAGCENLHFLDDEELALFDCPVAPEDPDYKARFVANLTRAISANKSVQLKPLQTGQTDRMFRAHRVWDATMAASITQVRAEGATKVLHLVGSFHSDFNGGLVQELRSRDPDARVLVICMGPKRSSRLSAADVGRADIVIYTRT
jgi:uncharacterized iron-regulated protein